MAIKIDYKKCCWREGKCLSCSCGGACIGCVEACPMKALKREKKLEIDTSKCINCGKCVTACKHKALSLV